MMTYLNIKDGDVKYEAETGTVYNCNGTVYAQSYTARAVRLTVPTAGTYEKLVDIVDKRRNMPTDGSWTDIKKSGVIKMTPGSVINESVSYPMATFERNVYAAHADGTWQLGHSCNCYGSPSMLLARSHAFWTEQGDFAYWSEKYGGLSSYDDDFGETANRITQAQTHVWSSLHNTYDLLTELAELRKTAQAAGDLLNAAYKLLYKLKRARKSIKPDDFASLWLQYRYGIMPIVYSIQDVAKIVGDSHNLYKKVVSIVNAEIVRPQVLPTESSYWHTSIYGSKTSKITGKARWSSGALQTLDQITFNFPLTAWELIPYSFVVDWFINIGDYISAVIGDLTSLSTQSIGCVGQRSKLEYRTYLHLYDDQRYKYKIVCPESPYTIVYEEDFGEVVEKDLLLSVRKVDNYDRYLFNRSSLGLATSAFSNWQRQLDLISLFVAKPTQALRRLS